MESVVEIYVGWSESHTRRSTSAYGTIRGVGERYGNGDVGGNRPGECLWS